MGMANLRMKQFGVLVLRSNPLFDFGPDVRAEVVALTELTAIQSVMRGAMMTEARAVYVQCEGQGCWFCGVMLVDGQVFYEYVA